MAFPFYPHPRLVPPAGEKKPAQPVGGVTAAEGKPKVKAKAKPASAWSWGLPVRILASAAIVFHLLAVFSAPWHFSAIDAVAPMVEPGGRPLDEHGRPVRLDPRQEELWQRPILPRLLSQNPVIRHYANLLYINSGYNFFSPDPGVSHLIRFEIFNDAGEKIVEGQLPDRRDEWPRLFYHRFMMLVDQSNDVERPNPAMADWVNKIAERLMVEHGGTRIKLTLVRHHLLTPQQVKDGARLDAPSTYETLVGPIEVRLPKKPQDPTITPGGAK
jgi:hypothetical protein